MSLFTKDKAFYRSFFRLTMTIAAQNLLTYSVSFADNVMLGTYHETALSGAALVNQIQFLLQMLTMGIGEGVTVLCSQYWGRKDVKSIKKIMAGGIFLGVILALVMWSVVFFCAPPGIAAVYR